MTKSIIRNNFLLHAQTLKVYKLIHYQFIINIYIVVKLFTLTNTNDKTRSIGSTFIWQLKYCFQWQAYFSPNFAQSGIHKARDIWDCAKNNFKDSNFIFNTLIDKRNWISQWTRLKKTITAR